MEALIKLVKYEAHHGMLPFWIARDKKHANMPLLTKAEPTKNIFILSITFILPHI
jgi:hypothetical protein